MTGSDGATVNNPFRKTTTCTYLARGPILVVAVAVSLSFPYIRDCCTAYTLIHLAVASLGFLYTCIDLSTFAKFAIRSGLNFAFDKIVLDDILRCIYDPTDGLIACTIGTYLGASSMYGLGMSEDQRVELIQSSLFLRDEGEAHSVLLEPGGCKILLPIAIRDWLRPLQKQKNETPSAGLTEGMINTDDSSSSCTDGVGLESDKSASDNDTVDANERDHDSHDLRVFEELSQNEVTKKIDSFKNETTGRLLAPEVRERKGANDRELNNHQADPVAVFFGILRKMTLQKLKTYAEDLPCSKIKNLGTAAAMAFGIQRALRRSSKNSHLIDYFCLGTTVLSFGTVLSREAYLGNIHDKKTMNLVCKDVASRILNKIKEQGGSKKAFFALLVFVTCCRRTQVIKGVLADDKTLKR